MSPTRLSPSYVNQQPHQKAPRPPPLSFLKTLKRERERSDRSIESNSTMKRSTSLGIVAASMALVLLFTMKVQHEHLMMESRDRPFDGSVQRVLVDEELAGLPRGIVAATSDMEMKPLWQSRRSEANGPDQNCTTLLAVAVGIMQKPNVDVMVRKFLSENFSVILFHYDGNVDGWHDLEWSFKVIHICAQNQTKWWFAKRFLHPDVVSFYDYIFLWDEDLGVENFHPRRYLQIVVSEGLEISQPALDPDSTDIHHRITLRNSKGKVHRRIYGSRGRLNCSDDSSGPPCTGWVEGMVPVFSRAAWRCVWHLIQNDLIHGWGLDMKLGYCAQGDRTKNVGVVDSEFVMHKGIPSLGGPSAPKAPSARTLDLRTHIRRQSTAELEKFKQRWDRAAREDLHWADPFQHFQRRRKA